MTDPAAPPRLALVGDRSSAVRAHARIPGILRGLAGPAREPLEAHWLRSTQIDQETSFAGFDGVWVLPGSPYASMDGVLAAIRAARTAGIPLLGTCGGFQHLLLELARNVCGLDDVEHAESSPDAERHLLVPLACSLLGEEGDVDVLEGTLAARICGAGRTTERYFCSYGLDPAYLPALEAHGLVVSGRDADGAVRIAELPGHPFYLGTLFQPELASDETQAHPLIRAFADAVRARAAAPTPA